MRVLITCKSPLVHGAFGEHAGNATLCRRMAVVSVPGMPRVPVVSGNALRGVLRRIVFRDLFARAELDRTKLHAGQWDRLYAALANGGHLEASEKGVDPEAIRALREELPPLSVFGAALYSWLLPGHMSVGILWPQCRETLEAGLVSDAGKGAGGIGAEDLVEEITLCRHVDREEQEPEVSGVTPMPTTVEAISAGAVLEGEIRFARHATEVERGVICYGLRRLSALGGKGGAGFGRVDVSDPDPDESGAYEDWLSSAPIRPALKALAESMGETKKKAKRAKAKPA